MQVQGPNWPSKRALAEALAHVESPKVIHWGRTPCNKYEAMRKFAEAGINTPDTTTDWGVVTQWRNAGVYVWGRKFSHMEGRDIRLHGQAGFNQSQFYVKFIPSSHEFRVHVWGGKAFRLGIKVHNDPAHASKVRSDRNGWKLMYSQDALTSSGTDTKWKAIRAAAVKACGAVGVDGGAVDIILGMDGLPYVLEVNTAPALGEFTLAAYVQVITAWAMTPDVPVAPVAPVDIPAPQAFHHAPAMPPGDVIIVIRGNAAVHITPGDPRYAALVRVVGA